MTSPSRPTSFALYRWANPETTSDYPYLAVAKDRSALLSLGDYGATLDWGIPDEARDWLARDFAPTGEVLECDLYTLTNVLTALFSRDAEFASVRFGAALRPSQIQLALSSDEANDQVPEYVIQDTGSYLRCERALGIKGPVAPDEQAMLDVCASTFAKLAAHYATKIIEPPPPRYRSSSAREPSGLN